MSEIGQPRGQGIQDFFSRDGIEDQCREAIFAKRWPNGFVCPRCTGSTYNTRPEVATRSDPILSATLLPTWHRIETALAATVLEGVTADLKAPVLSLPSARRFSARMGLCGKY
jgi:hypothetical protein